MSTPEERIAGRIRTTRERTGRSQEDVARQLRVTSRTYARWERLEGYGFIGRLADIARALGTTESELLGGENILTDAPTAEELADKLDRVLEELEQLRQDLT